MLGRLALFAALLVGAFLVSARVRLEYRAQGKLSRLTAILQVGFLCAYVLFGFLMTFLGYLAFLKAGAFPFFAVSWALFGISGGLFDPAYQSLISKVVPARMLGAFSGVFFSSLGFLSLPAPWLGAQLWERFDPRLPFVITAITALVTIIPVWFKFRLPPKADAASA